MRVFSKVSRPSHALRRRIPILCVATMSQTLPVNDPSLEPVREKVLAGEPLSHVDGVALYASRDLHSIGRLANLVREKLHGDNTYYNRNRHINYTNVCALSCKFCSFYRKRGEEGAYEMPVEQV